MDEHRIFSRFAPFIRDFIYESGWQHLRAVQLEAAECLFSGDGNLLVCSSTASGKTEAAFFPILTLLAEQPCRSFGVLYIAPLKSLINDQYERMEHLLRMSEVPLFHWHGDVAASHKNKALKDPKGILQITPESLESMLMNRPNDISRLFSDLRFVVIDELHSVMNSDRGRQITCQLARLGRLLGFHPRRIGLSATLGDQQTAAEFLGAGSGRDTAIADGREEKPRWRLGVNHFFVENGDLPTEPSVTVPIPLEGGDTGQPSESELLSSPVKVEEKGPAFDAGYAYMYACQQNRSCLVFSNSREETEYTTATLRQIAEKRGDEDVFLIHHGNLSASVREETEHKLKEGALEGKRYTACATVTLELGIDIGILQRIIHNGAPNSVSSFLQRLGRSGRRADPPEMVMILREETPLPNAPLPQIIPWELLRAIAVIQLYWEERFIEPCSEKKLPLSLLFQQTLSVLASGGERTPASLAGIILSMPAFRDVPREVYRELLSFMLKEDYLEATEEKGLIVGLKGERLTASFKFYATFKDSEDFTVRCGSDEIGTISSAPPVGDRFALAGRVWEVEELDPARRLIFVHGVKGKMEISWPGDYGEIHTKILRRMRQVLLEDTVYPYLLPPAAARLEAARNLARATGFPHRPVVSLGGYSYCMFPWLGTRAFRTMRRLLKKYAGVFGISGIEFDSCNYISFKMERGSAEDLPERLLALVEKEGLDPESLVAESEAPAFDKYDAILPPSLLRLAFATDRLSPAEVKERLREMAGET